MQDSTAARGDYMSTAFGGRRPRLSDDETERRMLQTASEIVGRSGLTVSLEHIRLEDVIRDAGVSRSAVYRRWPHKDMFLGDLLLELARAQAPMASTGSAEVTGIFRDKILDRLDRLESPEGRQELMAELVRVAAWHDFQHIYGSPQWRTYLALTVTFLGLPPGPLREQVQQALATSERTFTERIAGSYQLAAALFGLRPRYEQVSFTSIAHMANATIRGLIIKALATPDLADYQVTGEFFGSAGEWSLPALALAATLSTYVEPDPDVAWDQARITALRQMLTSTDDLFAPPEA